MIDEDDLRERFKEFHHQRCDTLFKYARSLTASDESAKDLLQDALLKVWKWFIRNPDKAEPDLKLVMFTIIRETAIDLFRRKGRCPIVPAAEACAADGPDLIENAAAEGPLPDELVNQPDLADKVRSAVERLENEAYRKLLTLYYLSGFEPTLKQVAEELGIKSTSVNTYHRRALQTLEKTLRTLAHELNINTKEA